MKIFKFFKKAIKRYNKNKNKKLISAEVYNELLASKQELDSVRQRQRQSTQKWKKKNPEKHSQMSNNWAKKNPEKTKEMKKAWRQDPKNKAKIKEAQKAWRRTPKGKASNAASQKRYHEKRKAIVNEALKLYLKTNPQKKQNEYKSLIKTQKNIREEEKRLQKEKLHLENLCKETNNFLNS